MTIERGVVSSRKRLDLRSAHPLRALRGCFAGALLAPTLWPVAQSGDFLVVVLFRGVDASGLGQPSERHADLGSRALGLGTRAASSAGWVRDMGAIGVEAAPAVATRTVARRRLRALRYLGLVCATYGLVSTTIWPAVRVLFAGADPGPHVSIWWLPFLVVALATARPRPGAYRAAAVLAVAGVMYYVAGLVTLLVRAGPASPEALGLFADGVLVIVFSIVTLWILGGAPVRAMFAPRRRDRLGGLDLLVPMCMAAALAGALGETVYRDRVSRPSVTEGPSNGVKSSANDGRQDRSWP